MPGRPAKPPASQAQRRLAYAAAAGKSSQMPQSVGREMVNAGHGVTGLPGRIGERTHDRPLRLGFKHAGSTVEGPDLGRALTASKTFTTGDREDASQFAHAGTTREGPNWSGAAKSGPTVSGGADYGGHGFANAGTSKEGPHLPGCVRAGGGASMGEGAITRPKIRRKGGSREHSGGSTDGFRVHTKPSPREQAGATSHYGTNLDEMQERGANPYSAQRPGQDSATIDMGVKSSPSPAPPGRQGRHAFKMAVPEFKGDKWIKGALKRPGALTKKAHAVGESPMGFARSHKGAPGRTGRQARFALQLRGFHHK